MSTTRTVFKFLVTAAVVAMPAVASAAPITFSFQAVVTGFDGVASTAFLGLTVNDIITGQYTFDSGAVDGIASATSGRFDFVAPGFTAAASIDVEGRTLRWTGTRVTTFNSSADFYRFQNFGAFMNDPLIGAANFLANLLGPSSVLPNDALPLTPPNLALFTTARTLSLFVETQDGGGNIFGTVTSLTADPAVVPEPASVLLFGGGLALLASRRRLRLGSRRARR